MAVTLSQTTATLYAGYTLQLIATDSLGGTITWSTSDSSSMTVVSGLVTCLIGKGNVNIIATSSAGGSATCVVTGYGISVGKVGKMLGSSSTSVGALCTSPKVNKFSIVHPVSNTSIKGPDNVWSTTGQQFYLQNGGGMTIDSWSGDMTLSGFLTAIENASTTNWAPVAIPPNYPKRLGDFRGYTSNKNASMMQKINSGLSYLYYSSTDGTEAGEYIERANWDTFILENSGLFGVKKFSDIWLDTTGTNNLSNYYLTVITSNNNSLNIKSIGKISTLFDSDGISQVIELENIIQKNLGPYSDHPNVQRWYFLTQGNVATASNFSTDRLAETHDTSQLVSNLSLGAVYQIPLCLKNGTPFYINNTIGIRTYIKMKFVNMWSFPRTIMVGLFNKKSGSEEETLISTNSITLAGNQTSSNYYVFNGLSAGYDYLKLRVISGMRYDDSLKLDAFNDGSIDMVRRVDTLGQLFMPMDIILQANAINWHTYDMRMWLDQEGIVTGFIVDPTCGGSLEITVYAEDSSTYTNDIPISFIPGDSNGILFNEGIKLNGFVRFTKDSTTVEGNDDSRFLIQVSPGDRLRLVGGNAYASDYMVASVIDNSHLTITAAALETRDGVCYRYKSSYFFHFGVLYTLRVVGSSIPQLRMIDMLQTATDEAMNLRDQDKNMGVDANFQVGTGTNTEMWFKFYLDHNSIVKNPRPAIKFYQP